MMLYITTFNGGCLQNYLEDIGKIRGKLPQQPLHGNGMAAISKIL